MGEELLPAFRHTIVDVASWTCCETPGDPSHWRVTHPVDGGDIFVSKEKCHTMLDAIQSVAGKISEDQIQTLQAECEHRWMAFPGAHPADMIGDMCWKCGVAF